MKQKTVGAHAVDLKQKQPDTLNPIELEQEMHTDYEKEVLSALEAGRKKFPSHDLFVVVITKKERLLDNVLRNYFFTRLSCPTPDYDQTVYRFTYHDEHLDLLWTIPSKDACLYLKNNASHVHLHEQQLLGYVLAFADGSLFNICKKLNKEE